MMIRIILPILLLMAFLSVICFPAAPLDVNQIMQEKGTPFTYLLDTGDHSPRPLSPDSIMEKKNWTLVPEDDTTHSFLGDAVFLNDQLAVVIRPGSESAEVYSLVSNPPALRASISPAAPEPDSTLALSAFSIGENSSSAVQVKVVFSSVSKQYPVVLRLTTGESILEAHPGRGSENISICADFQHVIVPDFFGDDMVFTANSLDQDPIYLPAEKFLIGTLSGYHTLLMCVWQSNRSTAHVQFIRQGDERKIHSLAVREKDEQTVWLAFLEHNEIWTQNPSSRQTSNPAPPWTPPFPAKWRMDVLAHAGQGESRPYTTPFTASHPEMPYLVYPMDRDANTPLSIYTPVDIMKNTLGVGPCQYILEAERLTSESQLTPDQAADWIEKQFSRKKTKVDPDQIAGALSAMNDIIRQTQARIQQYARHAAEIRNRCAQEMKNHPSAADGLVPLQRTLDAVQKAIGSRPDANAIPENAERPAARILQLTGQDNALAECKSACAELRALGAEQDYHLSKYRMLFRWLRQQCLALGEQNPAARNFLNTLRAQIGEILGLE
ncbi:MAG: hypothetical protein ACE15F_21400 [bacterium]